MGTSNSKPTLQNKGHKRTASFETYPTTTPKKPKTTIDLKTVNKYENIKERAKRSLYSMADTIRLPFVNREQSCEALMLNLIRQKTSVHGMLPILSQHYGSGKTRLVHEFRKALPERGDLSSLRLTESSNIVANNLMKATLVNMDMSNATLTTSLDNDLDFPNGAISDLFLQEVVIALKHLSSENSDPLILKSLRILNCISVPNIYDLNREELIIYDCLIKCTKWASFLRKYSQFELYPLLILIDEASYLEYHYKEGYSSFVNLWESTFKTTMGSYGDKVRTPGIYFIVCGVSSNLTKLGRGLLKVSNKVISPTPAVHIILDMLKVDHITEMFQKVVVTTDGNNIREFTEIFCNIGKNYEYFCKVVFIYTIGLPRLIEYVVLSLLNFVKQNHSIDFSSRERIDAVFDNFLMRKELALVRNAKEICPFYTNPFNDEKIDRLIALFTMGLMGFPVPIADEYISEIDLLHNLNVAVETPTVNDDRVFKMYIPKFTLIKAMNDNNMKHISILSCLPQRFYDYIDKGDLLKQLFLDTILTRILFTLRTSDSNEWDKIHSIFSLPKILKNKQLELDMNLPVRYLPKIVSSDNKNTPKALSFSKRHPWCFNMSYKFWNDLYGLQMNGGVIGHPAPKSKSPDFVISVPPNSAISIACKNFSSKFSLKEKLLPYAGGSYETASSVTGGEGQPPPHPVTIPRMLGNGPSLLDLRLPSNVLEYILELLRTNSGPGSVLNEKVAQSEKDEKEAKDFDIFNPHHDHHDKNDDDYDYNLN
ncbi:predicted protein [Naegleria gruberi]|uniref:Predicted protein n=1 Tax=Naegleria gruberi TaxID=5762 RepID=D2VYU3_NAEGR|nr:uncharacterized protein NAEGRDRAFT_74243 [Naegleria gruberi]EFC37970.1 predicted protein [Naegleria gruberi]|eukprot:XP_002670714.1 predicted protein [Naegleria gruberi strain NEG-M]